MIDWSTDHLPPRDRFEHWREEWARRVFGVEVEIEPERRHDFTGRIGTRALGPATLIEIEVTPYTTRRTRRAIDRTPDGSFYVWKMERGGGLIVADGAEQRVAGGAVMTMLANLPYTRVPDPNAAVLSRVVKIPLRGFEAATIEPAELGLRQHPLASGLDALLGGYLGVFLEQAPHLTGAAAEQAVRTLAQLALASRGVGDPRDEAGSAAIREGLLVRARRLVERDLHRPDLSPPRIAAALGISVRKLHLAFEPTGTSVSRYILERRLARADRMLAQSPVTPVTEVAYACGFDSLSTFFRCYRAAYGDSPGARQAARKGG